MGEKFDRKITVCFTDKPLIKMTEYIVFNFEGLCTSWILTLCKMGRSRKDPYIEMS